MSKLERRAYVHAIATRYAVAGRAQKSLMLDEYCATTKVGRKYAIRQLGRAIKALADAAAGVVHTPRPCSGRRSLYAADAELFQALRLIWEGAKRPCSKRLVALLPNWLPHYEAEYAVCLSRKTRRLFKRISASSIDRLLASTRKGIKETLHALSGTTPATEWLRALVPLRTHHHFVDRPGSFEGDTVSHCGSAIAGEYFWTLTATDRNEGWTECAAVWHKKSVGIKAALIGIEARLPFAMTSFDSDNGTEFINYTLQQHFANHRPPIAFTRSRPYEKNDQAYVEQKNGSVVRPFLGYQRLENPALDAPLNAFFAGCWRDYVNGFLPTLKLLRKEMVGSKTRRIYEPKAQTPYSRVMTSKHVSSKAKAALRLHYQTLNPFQLKREIDDTLAQIFNNARCTDL